MGTAGGGGGGGAAAAADDVGADHAVVAAQVARQRVEIAALSAQAVGADQHTRVGRVAPLPVRHAVQAAAAQARDTVQAGFGAWFAHQGFSQRWIMTAS